ncbi:uncharacterized protein LOC110636217 isoform X2 [Hevea brasiliensis]|uniref:uncharacterized protein LOC110636217 isoform X2 n=1 Tax=Hevea brasiliensis TaxID=3981 RepID=UPI0025E9200B|nr:uncharacterized protein LOC110636217 isoform X2 [Hevea brasiliensis]
MEKNQRCAHILPCSLNRKRLLFRVLRIEQNFPCQEVERHNKPKVELKTSPVLLLNPILICRNEAEKCLIETSINSLRISLKIFVNESRSISSVKAKANKGLATAIDLPYGSTGERSNCN